MGQQVVGDGTAGDDRLMFVPVEVQEKYVVATNEV